MAKKYSYWVQSGKYSMLQKVFILLFGVLSFMILARGLTPDELGVWGLFLIITSIVETLRNSLIKNGYILFIHTRGPEDHPGIEYAAILTNVIYSFLFIVVFLIFSGPIERAFNADGLAILLNYYCITLVLLIPFSYLEIFLITKADFRSVFWMYFIRNGLLFTGVAILHFSSLPLTFYLLALVYTFCTLMGLAAGWFMSRRDKKATVKKNTKILPAFIAFGKFVFANNLFSLVFRSTDSFSTASLISPAVSAIYSTCGRITTLVDMPSQVFADIMFPKAAQVMKGNDKDGLKLLYEKTVAASLTFTIPAILFIVLFPKFILLTIAGSQYVSSSPILQIIVWYGFFLPFIKQFGNIMDVLNRPQVNAILMAVFAALNIGLNVLGIYLFGIYGSAYATLLSYILLFITTQILLRRSLHVSPGNIFKNILMFYPAYLKLLRGVIKKPVRTL
jgi:lipopolysaccharide exporter